MARPWARRHLKATKKNLGWPEDKSFYVPEEARKNWETMKPRARSCTSEWNAQFEEYKRAYPEPAARVRAGDGGEAPDGLGEGDSGFPTDKPVATRNAGRL